MEAPAAKGKKGLPATVEVLLYGVAVEPCTAPLVSAAAPDLCWSVNRYDVATNDDVVNVRASSIGLNLSSAMSTDARLPIVTANPEMVRFGHSGTPSPLDNMA